MVRLFTSIYPEARPGRQQELRFAYLRNIECASIDRIFVLSEGTVSFCPHSPKLSVKETADRPTYEDFFNWINESVRSEDISIIANSDISFDDTLRAAAKSLGPKECYALTRWEGGNLFYRNDSQDSWIFRGPVRGVSAPFPVGVPRCDNRLMYELEIAGYRVLNPSLTIVSTHHHTGERVEYSGTDEDGFVPPPYRYMWPHNLWSLVATLSYNLSNRDAPVTWRFDRRKAAASVPVRVVRHAASLPRRLKNLCSEK